MKTLVWADIGVALVVHFGSFGFRKGGSLPFQETLIGACVVSGIGPDAPVRTVGRNGVHKPFGKEGEISPELLIFAWGRTLDCETRVVRRRGLTNRYKYVHLTCCPTG